MSLPRLRHSLRPSHSSSLLCLLFAKIGAPSKLTRQRGTGWERPMNRRTNGCFKIHRGEF